LSFDNQWDDGGNGGTVTITVDQPQPPTIDVTLDPIGKPRSPQSAF
jgi:hypothetical protein